LSEGVTSAPSFTNLAGSIIEKKNRLRLSIIIPNVLFLV